MGKPILVIASSQADTRAFLGDLLQRRFGADYDTVAARSADDVMAQLGALRGEGRPVALVICSSLLEGSNGVEMLTQVHSLHPHAGRVLLMRWGDREAARIILHAMALGRIDDAIYLPTSVPDEEFYRRVTELLEEWNRQRGTHLEVVRIIDHPWSSRGHDLLDAMERNRVPYGFVDADGDDGQRLLAQLAPEGPLPVLVIHGKVVLKNPSNFQIAETLGANARLRDRVYDVVIVGAGPAGLASAVYASSEGLRCLVIEPMSLGGQAGASSRIRNYPGFPRGISGADFASRTYQQAWFFGTDFLFAQEAVALHDGGDHHVVHLNDARIARGRTVVIACGVNYRRLALPNVERLTNAGVFYGAPTTEARALEGQRVYVAGGGNSAGQAVVHLAKFASRVDMLVRGRALRGTMSRYLLQELEDLPNVHIRYESEVIDAVGDRFLEALVIRDHEAHRTTTEPASGLFVFIGALPHTAWLQPTLRCDSLGYVLTGAELMRDGRVPEDWPLKRAPFPYETCLPGVFAVGDVRHNSVKRVTSAVGEGAMAVPYLHARVAEVAAARRKERPARPAGHPTQPGPTVAPPGRKNESTEPFAELKDAGAIRELPRRGRGPRTRGWP